MPDLGLDEAAALFTHRNMSKNMFHEITDGRTDLVFDYVAAGHAATSADQGGVSLLQWCSYYGDVSAINSAADMMRSGVLPRPTVRILKSCRGYASLH